MRFLITKTVIIYEKDIKDTLSNEFETNDLHAERAKLIDRYQCKEIHFNFIDLELDSWSKEMLYSKIDRIIANHFNTSSVLMKAKSREREIADARNVAMWWHCKNGSGSLKTIGTFYGDVDHSTVFAARKKVNNLIETNSIFREKINAILAEIELLKR